MQTATDNRTDWMETFTGRRFYPLEPNPDDICIEDIAHVLSMICRFGGHCKRFYSVAQHSCLVADLVLGYHSRHAEPPSLVLDALMHDSAEAYVGDVIRPIKRGNPLYGSAETAVAKCIERVFMVRLVHPMPEVVKWADNVMLKNEHAQLMHGRNEWPSCDQAEGPEVLIDCWGQDRAEFEFMTMFELWSRGHNA